MGVGFDDSICDWHQPKAIATFTYLCGFLRSLSLQATGFEAGL